MRKVLTVILMICIAGAMNMAEAQPSKMKRSEWKYEVKRAPEGYEKGTIILTGDHAHLKGEVKLSSGYTVKMDNITLKKDTLKATVFVESEYVQLQLKMNEQTMRGTANTSMGFLEVKAERVVKEKKR
jgi:hypothetical protein